MVQAKNVHVQEAIKETPTNDKVLIIFSKITLKKFQKLKEKDLVAICDVGAYGMSLSSNYNLRPKAVELLIKGRKIKIIKNRQKHTDLI